MAFEQKNNSGALFKNDNRTSDNHPHAKGKCLIDGVEYWVSAWTKEGSKGRFQSLSFQPVQKSQEVAKATGKPASHQAQESRMQPDDLNDDLSDVPF